MLFVHTQSSTSIQINPSETTTLKVDARSVGLFSYPSPPPLRTERLSTDEVRVARHRRTKHVASKGLGVLHASRPYLLTTTTSPPPQKLPKKKKNSVRRALLYGQTKSDRWPRRKPISLFFASTKRKKKKKRQEEENKSTDRASTFYTNTVKSCTPWLHLMHFLPRNNKTTTTRNTPNILYTTVFFASTHARTHARTDAQNTDACAHTQHKPRANSDDSPP